MKEIASTDFNSLLRQELTAAPASAREVTLGSDYVHPEIEAQERERAAEAALAATPEPAEEEPVEEVAPPPKPTQTREELRIQALIDARSAAKQERDALKAEQAARQLADTERAELEEYRELRRMAKEDPVYVADKLGYKKPDEFATALIDKGAMTPDRRRMLELEREVKESREWRQSFEKRQQETSAEQAMAGKVAEAQRVAASDADRFELVSAYNAYGLAVQRQLAHYQETAALGAPEILPMEECLEAVEQHIFETTLKPVLNSKKLSGARTTSPAARPSPAPVARKSGPTQARPQTAAASKTPKSPTEPDWESAAAHIFRGTNFLQR